MGFAEKIKDTLGAKSEQKNFQIFFAIVISLLVRLIPFRAPNIEPILGVTMPFSKFYGALAGAFFAMGSILLYDVITRTLGAQTFFTIFAYGALGAASAIYFKKKEASAWNFARFAIFATLFYDAVTGLTVGPLIFHQTFSNAFVGQIPFTMLHLLGNVTFALVLSPAIYKFLIKKRKRKYESEIGQQITNLNPKII